MVHGNQRVPSRSLQSWANLMTLFHPIPALLISSITVLLHVVLGCSLFLLPSGVHVSAVLACAVGSERLRFLSCGMWKSDIGDFIRPEHSHDSPETDHGVVGSKSAVILFSNPLALWSAKAPIEHCLCRA